MRKFVLVAALFTLSACQNNTQTNVEKSTQPALDAVEKSAEKKPAEEHDAMTIVTGTIQYKTFEGGFYALDADNGEHYTPVKLDKAYLQHGLRVRVTGTILKDVMTITQYGSVLEVSDVVVLDDSKVTKPDEI